MNNELKELESELDFLYLYPQAQEWKINELEERIREFGKRGR